MPPEAFETITLDPVDRCIYCSSTTNLEDEHIVPYSLDGHIVLPKASCRECARITSYIEGYCTRKIFFAHRVATDMQTRRRSERPSHLPITLIFDDHTEERHLSAEIHPGLFALIAYQRPGMLDGRPEDAPFGKVTYLLIGQDLDQIGLHDYVASQGAIGAQLNWHFDAIIFARLLAKIAHASAIALFGMDGFEPFLPRLILNKNTVMPYYVGTDREEANSTEYGHQIFHRGMHFQDEQLLLSYIQLFAKHTTPEYCVVTGKLPPDFEPSPEGPMIVGPDQHTIGRT